MSGFEWLWIIFRDRGSISKFSGSKPFQTFEWKAKSRQIIFGYRRFAEKNWRLILGQRFLLGAQSESWMLFFNTDVVCGPQFKPQVVEEVEEKILGPIVSQVFF